MSSITIVTFYKVVSIKNVNKLKREVERVAYKKKLSGTFFATPQGINATLAGKREGLEMILTLFESFKIIFASNLSVIDDNIP